MTYLNLAKWLGVFGVVVGIILGIGFAIESIYERGESAGKAAGYTEGFKIGKQEGLELEKKYWEDYIKSEQNKYNTKIASIQGQVNVNYSNYQKELQSSKLREQQLTNEIAKYKQQINTGYTDIGIPIKCEGKQVEVYLGLDFIRMWNESSKLDKEFVNE